MPMLMSERLAYLPIVERSPLRLPDGARMAVWVIVAVEEWDPTQPMPRTVLTPPAGVRQCPTCLIGLGTNTATSRVLEVHQCV